jgi:uncharacterized protein YjbI with pentapeptide repeats
MNYYDEKIFNDETFNELLPYQTSEFINCSFEFIDFSSMNLSLSKFIECKFSNCNLSNVSLKNTSFRDIKFTDCKLIGLNWSETQVLSLVEFKNSILDFCIFQSLKLAGTKFINCSIKEADFYEATLTKAEFSESNLSQTSFNKANLAGADFIDATGYFIDPRVTNIKKAKFKLPEALSLLQSFEIVLE